MNYTTVMDEIKSGSMLYDSEVRERLHSALDGYPSQAALAAAIGISPSLLNKILKGERDCGPQVAEFFGLKTIRLYVKPVEKEGKE